MSNSPFTPGDQPGGTKQGQQFGEAAGRATGRVAEFGRAAAESASDSRGTAADGIESAASSLRSAAERLPGGETTTKLANRAAESLSSTADYVRQADMARMRADAERLVRDHPGPVLLAAAVVGFLVARTLPQQD